MSELTSPPASPGHPKMQNRRLSKIQDTAVDDLHDITTHALDDKSPPPHHESSVMSYMEAHSRNDESAHKCIPRSPLLSRSNSVGDDEEETVSEVEKTEERGKIAFSFLVWSVLGEAVWLIISHSSLGQGSSRLGHDAAGAISEVIFWRTGGKEGADSGRCRGRAQGDDET